MLFNFIFMNRINITYYKTKIWELILGEFEWKVCMVDYRYRRMRKTVDNRISTWLKADFVENETNILKELKKQLDEYLAWERKEFDLNLILVWTDFQKQVWEELQKITYWETCSYLDLARRIWNEKSVRAVANANWANSIWLIVPCHRIIETNGWLWGFAWWVNMKKKLLNMEQKNK
jgi:methylated-DNA-[protein]-cysteine S-methyltransferase